MIVEESAPVVVKCTAVVDNGAVGNNEINNTHVTDSTAKRVSRLYPSLPLSTAYSISLSLLSLSLLFFVFNGQLSYTLN